MPEGVGGRRMLGTAAGGVRLSPLTFGTMRLDHVGDVRAVARLIREAHELGVSTFHVSREYSTWPLFQEAWREADLARDSVEIIAKIGEPHFGEDRFDPTAFTAKIDDYRSALGADSLSVVQWLLRHDLAQEKNREAIFDRDSDLIGRTVDDLKAADAIGAMISFPYTASIAGRALSACWCDGLALYCNPLELEAVELLDRAADCRKAVIAIRPFAAGRLFSETAYGARDGIQFPLSHPAVVSVVASTSGADRLREAWSAAQDVDASPESWRRTRQRFGIQ